MLKNHYGCVKRMIEHPDIDLNCKDEKGRTLISLSLLAIDEATSEFINYLLKKGANPNIADTDGNTPFHVIARYNPAINMYNSLRVNHLSSAKEKKAEMDRLYQIQLDICF